MRVGVRFSVAVLVAAVCAGARRAGNEGPIGSLPAGGRISRVSLSRSANFGACLKRMSGSTAEAAAGNPRAWGTIELGEGKVMRLRGGVVDAFSPYSNTPMVELSEYMMADPNWCPTSTEETDEDGSDEEQVSERRSHPYPYTIMSAFASLSSASCHISSSSTCVRPSECCCIAAVCVHGCRMRTQSRRKSSQRGSPSTRQIGSC